MVVEITAGDKARSTLVNGVIKGATRNGVLTGLTVTEKGAGADMSVDVATGRWRVGGKGYATVAVTNVVVGAAHASLNRFDLIVANSSGAVTIIAGTAATVPQYPALTAATIPLAIVSVPTGTASIVNANISDASVSIAKSASVEEFGGTGADGDLAVTSGTTNISLDTVYNYSSVSISAAATLSSAANGSPMFIKCAGDCTIDGTINLDGKGYSGGAGGASANTAGAAGTGFADIITHGTAGGGGGASVNGGGGGGAGGASMTTSGGAGGAGGGVTPGSAGAASVRYSKAVQPTLWTLRNLGLIGVGTGGGGGGAGTGAGGEAGGAGGAGGGGLVIEVGGNLSIGAAGVITADGVAGGNGASYSGGGGGGGGGSVIVRVRGTITNAGTVTVTGGSAGSAGASGGTAGAGGAGFYIIEAVD